MKVRLRRRIAATGAAVTAAAALTGCVGAIQGDAPSQVDEIGKVRISTDLCIGLTAAGGFLGGDPTEGCRAYEDTFDDVPPIIFRDAAKRAAARTGSRPTHTDVVESLLGGISMSQVLVAYKVPAGTEAPASISGAVDLDDEFVEDVNQFISPLLWELAWADDDDYYDRGYLGYAPRPAPAIPTAEDPSPVRPLELPDSVSFRQDDSYSASLADLEPAGAGQKWVGYVSEQLPMFLTGNLKLDADFSLPETADGTPYAGPFPHVTTVGSRLAVSREDIESLALSADVFTDALGYLEGDIMEALAYVLDDENGGDIFLPFRSAIRGGDDEPSLIERLETTVGPDREVICSTDDVLAPRGVVDVEDIAPALCSTEPAEGVEVDRSLSTRDLVITGGDVTVQQGDTAKVPFTLDFAGPAVTQPLAMETDNEIPYAGGERNAGVFQPGADQDGTQVVEIPVPADARPGTYDVVLRAGLPAALASGAGDAIREGVGKVTVTAKPLVAGATPPVPAVTIANRTPQLERLYVGRDGTVAFGFVCPAELATTCERAVADVLLNVKALGGAKASQKKAVFRMTKIGTKRFKAKAGKRVRVKVKLGKKGRKALANGKRLNGRLVIKAGKTKQVRRISLRRG